MKRWLYVGLAVAAAAGAWWWWKRRKVASVPVIRGDRPASVTPPRPMVAGVPIINYASETVGRVVPSPVAMLTGDADDGLFRGS